MPIYEYKCTDCGEVSEVLTGMGSRDELPVCKHCGSDRVERILSASFISVKGGMSAGGTTCCGRTERCETPPCSTDNVCKRD
jgi:putative FmdB family regulatory protein